MSTYFVLWILLVSILNQFETGLAVVGPANLNSRIAIVGGGPAAIDAYKRLTEKGYTSLSLYEAEFRLGGIVESLYINGFPYELGPGVIMPHETITKGIVEQYGCGGLTQVYPKPTVFEKQGQTIVETPMMQYVYRELKALKPTYAGMSDLQLKNTLKGKLDELETVCVELFGPNRGLFPNTPDAAGRQIIKTDMNKNFSAFLVADDLAELVPLLKFYMTSRDYNDLDQIPAMHAMIALSPDFIAAIKKNLDDPDDTSIFYMIPESFQRVWEHYAEKNNILPIKDYNLGYRVYKIERNTTSNEVCMFYHKRVADQIFKRCVDFVVLTTDLKKMQFSNPTALEEKYFGRNGSLLRQYAYTSAILTEPTAQEKLDGIQYFGYTDKIDYCATKNVPVKAYMMNGTSMNLRPSVCMQVRPESNALQAYDDLREVDSVSSLPPDFVRDSDRHYLATRFPVTDADAYFEVMEAQGKDNIWYVDNAVTGPGVEGELYYLKKLFDAL